VDDFDWDSEFSEEHVEVGKKRKRVAAAVHTPQMLRLADDIDANVMHPKRFSYGYVLKDHQDLPNRGRDRIRKVDYNQCVLHLFRRRPNWRQLLTDITPWLVIALNDSWLKVTNRMLQLLYCESIPEPTGEFKSRLTANTALVCYEMGDTHFELMMIAFAGLMFWSVGIICFLYFIIQSHDLQSAYVQRNFGYLIEGYEPQTWSWELTVKKADLMTTAMISFTSLASDSRAKLLLYSMQSFIALAVQLSAGPFDDRQLRLLDRMETTGLIVRNVLFTGIAIALLFDLSNNLVLFIALLVSVSVLVFLVRLLFHSIDDFIGTKVIMVHEQRMRLAHDMEEKRRVRVLDGVHPDDLTDDKADTIRMRSLNFQERLVKWIYDSVFYGEWRRHQLLHLDWSGPGSDAQVFMPLLYDGYPYQKITTLRTFSLHAIQFIFNLNQDFQLEVLKNLLEDFVNQLIQLAKFRQLPAQLTDMIFFLARAVKLMKKSMMEHPNTKRVVDSRGQLMTMGSMQSMDVGYHAGDHEQPTRQHRHTEILSDLDRLKTAMLEETFDRLLAQTKRKAELIAAMREKFAGVEVIEKENFPMQAAWDIMDKLTNDQLQRAATCPVHLYKRVNFNLSMSRCSIDLRDAMHIVKGEQKALKERRKEIYTFISFALRRRLEAIPDVDWAAVRKVLDMLPVEELERLGRDPELCIAQVLEAREQEEKFKRFRGDTDFFLTVEDISSMLMYIQKLPYNELHLLIEYTQLLLDYLTLPTNAGWREGVAARGEREHAAPDFYHSILRLKRQLRDQGEKEAGDDKDEAAADATALPSPSSPPARTSARTSDRTSALSTGVESRADVILSLDDDSPKRDSGHARRRPPADPLLTVPVIDDGEDDDSSLTSMDSLVANMLGIEDDDDEESYQESIVGELIQTGIEEDEEDEDEEMEEDATISASGSSDSVDGPPSPQSPRPTPPPAETGNVGFANRLEALRRKAGAGALGDWNEISPPQGASQRSDRSSSQGTSQQGTSQRTSRHTSQHTSQHTSSPLTSQQTELQRRTHSSLSQHASGDVLARDHPHRSSRPQGPPRSAEGPRRLSHDAAPRTEGTMRPLRSDGGSSTYSASQPSVRGGDTQRRAPSARSSRSRGSHDLERWQSQRRTLSASLSTQKTSEK